MDEAQKYRQSLTKAKRIVVKVGTRILVNEDGSLNHQRIAHIVEQLVALREAGKDVVLVSSGAIGAGLHVLGMKRRPTALPELQMAASVGQTRLIEVYHQYFVKAGHCISQVLLTHADLRHRGRHLNARNAMLKLLSHNVIPIVNENDVVSVDEIRVGDNDILSSLVTVLIDADVLVILTSPDGLQAPSANGKMQRVNYLPRITPKTYQLVTKKTEALSTGGMSTKLKAAQTVAKGGALVVIASGQKEYSIIHALEGKDEGTLIGNEAVHDKLAKRKRWIRYFHRAQGQIIVDVGAKSALMNHNKSLLPIGIEKINGQFSVGAMVEIFDSSGDLIGQGLVEYGSGDIEKIKGKSSIEIEKILGFKGAGVVIHRDNMVAK